MDDIILKSNGMIRYPLELGEPWLALYCSAQFKTRVPGFDRVGRVNLYFKKNSKRRRFSKKTKANGLQPGFAGSIGSPGRPGHTGS